MTWVWAKLTISCKIVLAYYIVICTHHGFLWHNLATERFYVRVFLLLGYLSTTANEHYQSGFKVFHLVGVELHFMWSISADLHGMGNSKRRFLSPASTTLQVMEAHKHFHHGKVVVSENELFWWSENFANISKCV